MSASVCDFFCRSWKTYNRISYVAQDKDDIELLLWGKPIPGIKPEDAFPAKPNHPLLTKGQTRLFFDFPTWSAHLKEMDFVFGTRIHGNVAALLSGVPAFVVAHDSRTLELAEFFDIPFIRSSDVTETTEINDLYQSANYGKMISTHQVRFDSYVRFLENNGLDHIYKSDGEAPDFDERMTAAEFAPGLIPLSIATPSEIARRMTKLHAAVDKEKGKRR